MLPDLPELSDPTDPADAPVEEAPAAPDAPPAEEEQALSTPLPSLEELCGQIRETTLMYTDFTGALVAAEIDLMEAQERLADARSAILTGVADPKELGANEAARAAALDARTATERAAVLALECRKRDAQGARDISHQMFRRHEMVLRLLELRHGALA
jgi:hypothetical protein